MEIWSSVSKMLLLLTVLLLMLYDVKVIRKLVFKSGYISPGTGLLILGTLLFTANSFLARPYLEPLSISLITVGVFLYVYRLIRLSVKLNYLANRDILTGIANRRSLARMINNVEKLNDQTSILFLDIDDFKSINDQFGHLAADEILCSVINEMQKNLRSTDILIRYGGDEFVIILPKTSKTAALAILERLKDSVYNLKNNNSIKVSFSAGVATSPEDGKSLKELINVADQKMYMRKAKSSLRTIS